MAQTRTSIFTHSYHSFIIAAVLLYHPTRRSSSVVVQSGLLVAESEPILALVEAVHRLQIQDVFLPLTKTQEDRGADGSLQPVHNHVTGCFFMPPQKCPNCMLLVWLLGRVWFCGKDSACLTAFSTTGNQVCKYLTQRKMEAPLKYQISLEYQKKIGWNHSRG